jgi:phosphoribosyl-dephospho-CoA transferase
MRAAGTVGAPMRRHDMAYLDSDAWRRFLAMQGDRLHPAGMSTIVDQWADEGRPVIVRRPSTDEIHAMEAAESPHVAVGLAFPPHLGKWRLGYCLPCSVIRSVTSPPTLDSVRGTAPVRWQGALEAILMRATEHAVQVHVYGALAWQSLTGWSYLRDGSDVDLLFSIQPGKTISEHEAMRVSGGQSADISRERIASFFAHLVEPGARCGALARMACRRH